MPYSIDQKAKIAEAIDTILGTSAAGSSYTTPDLLLSWMQAAAGQLQSANTQIQTLSTQLSALEAKIATLIQSSP